MIKFHDAYICVILEILLDHQDFPCEMPKASGIDPNSISSGAMISINFSIFFW